MKKILFICLLWQIAVVASAQNSLSGKITGGKENEIITGATIYISDLKRGTVSDTNGFYELKDLPPGKFLVEYRFLGYETKILKLEIKGKVIQDIQLAESHTELKDVLITGMSAATEKAVNPVPSFGIDKEQLQETASSNIIDAISSMPGISQISTGAGISKPVIRGLGFNRVLVLQNNIRQEGQQWGEEHGIEIDEFSVNRIEIIKGPGSLAYGSDAMAGVINMLSPEPVEKGKQNIIVTSAFHSNNLLQGYSLFYEGNKNNCYWNLQGTRKKTANYSNTYDGKVFNSGFNEINGNGMVGVSKKWGYVQLNFSTYNQKAGIIEGERDSSGNFTETTVQNDTSLVQSTVDDATLKSYAIHLPYQKTNHHRLSLNGKFFKKNSVFQYTFGFQQNHRREYELHEHDGIFEEEAGIYQLLNTYNYDINYHNHFSDWETTFGINGYFQQGINNGEEFIIPEYSLNDAGFYGITQRIFNKLLISGGLRYNWRNITTEPLYLTDEGEISSAADSNSTEKFRSFEKNFSSFAYSAGFSYRIKEKLIAKANFAGGFRAPNMAESGSNGAHHGTFRYEIGNPELKPETSFQSDLSLFAETEHFSLEFAAFYNQVSDYIYTHKLLNAAGQDSLITDEGNLNRVYVYTQDDARLYGGEITVDIHPHPFDWLHFENSFSLVNSQMIKFTDSTGYLPFTPSPRLQTELRAEFHKPEKKIQKLFFTITFNYQFEQNRIYSAYNTETITPSYFLLNAGLGIDLENKKGKKIVSFIISAHNLTNTTYQNHLSRLKYLSVNPATGREGVFNMGRNFMVKLIIPLSVVK